MWGYEYLLSRILQRLRKIHVFNEYFLSSYYVVGTDLGN